MKFFILFLEGSTFIQVAKCLSRIFVERSKMIKHEYNVLKAFTIYTDESRKRIIGTSKNEKKHGSTFAVRSSYVDYKFPGKNIELASITKELVKKKFVKLARLIKRGRDRQTS